jgi:tetratricopeptide (TPR) repeat protein
MTICVLILRLNRYLLCVKFDTVRRGKIMKKVLFPALLLLLIVSSRSNSIAGRSASDDFLKADRMYAAGKYSDALALYQGLLSRQSESVQTGDVHSRIGDCFFRLNDYENALQAYRRAVQSQKPSQRPATQYWIGFCTFLLGRDRESVAEFLKVPELYPDSGMWVSTAYYWAGRASERMGRKEQAAEYYRKAGGKGKSTQERFAIKKAEGVKGK